VPQVTWGTKTDGCHPIDGVVPDLTPELVDRRTAMERALGYMSVHRSRSLEGMEVDWALSAPVPTAARDCRQRRTV